MMRYLLSLLLLIVISCSPVKKLQDLPEVKTWEPEIEKFEAADRSEQYPSDAIIFAGSSTIRLWTTMAEDMAPFSVIPRGYGGAKLTDFAVYADRIFSPHPCRAAVLFIANDITGSKQDKSPEEVRDLFLSVLKTFRKSHRHTPLVWIAVTPTPSRWKAWPEIKTASDLIEQECKKHHNTYFIRTAFAFIDRKGDPRPELFRADKLHLNAEGYKTWSAIVKNELVKILNK